MRSWIVVCCTFLLAGCETQPSDRWGGTIDTLASGVVVATNTRDPVWDSTTRWRLVERLRIGSVDGGGPETFGRISAVERDTEGRVWVLDPQGPHIVVFGADGEHVRTIGREGAGPGEFRQPFGLEMGPDGRIWVPDARNARYTVLDTAGNVVAGYRRPLGSYSFPWPGGIDDEGRLYDYVFSMRQGGPSEKMLLRMSPEGDAMVPADTIRIPEPPATPPSFELVTESGRTTVGVPFSPSFQWRLSPQGYIWTAYTSDYRLTKHALSGDTLRVISKEYDPVPVTSEEVDEAIAGLEWFTRRGGRVDPSRIPDTKPAFRTFFVDGDGYVWVELNRPAAANPDGPLPTWDIFDPEGRYLGVLEAELESHPQPAVSGGHVVGVVKDELDVPFVVVYRIEGRGSGSGD